MPGVKKAPKPRVVRKKAVTQKRATKKRVSLTGQGANRPAMAVREMLECVFGPVSMTNKLMGVPDGDQTLGYTQELRSVIQVKPDTTGAIVVALHPSIMGAWAISRGKVTVLANGTGTADGLSTGPGAHVFDSDAAVFVPPRLPNAGARPFMVVPFEEMIASTGTSVSSVGRFGNLARPTVFDVGATAEFFRVITNTGTFEYVGAPLTASGAVACARADIHVDQYFNDQLGANGANTPGVISAQGDLLATLSDPGPNIFETVASMTGALTSRALDGGKVINVPTKWDYQPVKMALNYNGSNPTGVDSPFALLTFDDATGNVIPCPTPGIGWASTTVIAMTGLPADAVVIFDARTCMQLTVKPTSQVRHMARPSPPKQAAALDAVAVIAPKLPPSAPTGGADNGWISNLAGSYADNMKKALGMSWSLGAKVLKQVAPGIVGKEAGGLAENLAAMLLN